MTHDQIRHQIYRDSTLKEIYYSFKAYHRRLAAEYAKPIAERQNVAELEEKANALEKELVLTPETKKHTSMSFTAFVLIE